MNPDLARPTRRKIRRIAQKHAARARAEGISLEFPDLFAPRPVLVPTASDVDLLASRLQSSEDKVREWLERYDGGSYRGTLDLAMRVRRFDGTPSPVARTSPNLPPWW